MSFLRLRLHSSLRRSFVQEGRRSGKSFPSLVLASYSLPLRNCFSFSVYVASVVQLIRIDAQSPQASESFVVRFSLEPDLALSPLHDSLSIFCTL